MGWTSYHASHYKNGKVDRKAECDAYFEEGLNQGWYRIVKSAMVGNTYYAAVQSLRRYVSDGKGNRTEVDVPEAERTTWAAVSLTHVDNKEYFNFSYKSMSENEGPAESKCPASILKLLSETEDEWAKAWRERCHTHAKEKSSPNSLSKLPVGTKIRVTLAGYTVELTKHPAAYQFKRPFWYCEERNAYMQTKHIPEDFEIVKA